MRIRLKTPNTPNTPNTISNTSKMSARRLSPLRMVGVVAVAAGLTSGASVWTLAAVRNTFTTTATVWYSPYVDVSLTPVMHFEDPQTNPADDVVLSFVVADPNAACAPSWGTFYSLDAAGRALDLDRRIARLRERGGDITVSFGGALNQELARTCTDEADLVAAYQSVIDRYQVERLDFDIEGEALSDLDANRRRGSALATLAAANPDLQLWLTVPVSTAGLTQEAVDLVDTTLAAGVKLSGVNVMTMNFGASRTEGQTMYEASAVALEAAFQQLSGSYQRAGRPLTPAQLWSHLGATPMIGQNDLQGEIFTLDDAARLVAFAGQRELGRLSIWSANRDNACGVHQDSARASNTCTGVEQAEAAFGLVFAAASAPSHLKDVTPPAYDDAAAKSASLDDPATSPYPIWRSAKTYLEGDKVVWHGNVYQAKWWAEGALPDAPVTNLWDTPWRYLGPVLPGDASPPADAVARVDGQQQRWSADGVYFGGTQVVHQGQIYQAKWWTQGVAPEQDSDRPFDHPWEYRGAAPPAVAEMS